MVSPFNMPDKFVQGFFKSGQSLLQAFAGTGGASVGTAAPASQLALLQSRYGELQFHDALEALQSELASARSLLERGATVLADERQGHSKTSAELREATLERTKLAQEVSDLRDRLAAEERHRQSLEEKHKHAHESLEHFRQSVKEQRE